MLFPCMQCDNRVSGNMPGERKALFEHTVYVKVGGGVYHKMGIHDTGQQALYL